MEHFTTLERFSRRKRNGDSRSGQQKRTGWRRLFIRSKITFKSSPCCCFNDIITLSRTDGILLLLQDNLLPMLLIFFRKKKLLLRKLLHGENWSGAREAANFFERGNFTASSNIRYISKLVGCWGCRLNASPLIIKYRPTQLTLLETDWLCCVNKGVAFPKHAVV